MRHTANPTPRITRARIRKRTPMFLLGTGGMPELKEDGAPSRSLLSEVGAVDITFYPTFVVNQFRREGRAEMGYIDGRMSCKKVSDKACNPAPENPLPTVPSKA